MNPPLYSLGLGRCVLISDVHLNGGARDLAPLSALRAIFLEGALAAPAEPPPEHLIIVGDLFDFHLGYQSAPYPHLTPAYELLAQIKARGASLWCFTGNHDPDPCPWLKALGAEVLTRRALFELTAEGAPPLRVLIEHGDLLEPSRLKRGLCRLARAPWVCSLARLLPPPLALTLAPRLPPALNTLAPPRSTSLKLAPLLLKALSSSWRSQRAPEALGARLWIMGHFHQLALEALPPNTSSSVSDTPQARAEQLLVLGDWVKLNSLALLSAESLTLFQCDVSLPYDVSPPCEASQERNTQAHLSKERSPTVHFKRLLHQDLNASAESSPLA